MTNDEIVFTNYLEEVQRQTGGDPAAQVSMHDAGENLGLDRNESARIAEELMVKGLLELKTLAGGIGITAEGLESLGISPGIRKKNQEMSLSSGPVLSDGDRALLEELLPALRGQILCQNKDYQQLEELVIDLKTLELQLHSPRPKTILIKAILACLAEVFMEQKQGGELATTLEGLAN